MVYGNSTHRRKNSTQLNTPLKDKYKKREKETLDKKEKLLIKDKKKNNSKKGKN